MIDTTLVNHKGLAFHCTIVNILHCFYSLNDLQDFINVTSSGLNVEVGDGDYDGLIGVMGHLLAIKDRQPMTDVLFEPLKETIELLQSYGHIMSDEVHQQLEVH